MRLIKYIVIHCTATSQKAKVSSILNYWYNDRGWKNPGYHRLIEANGHVNYLQHFDDPANGVRGYNHESIHISYIGGQDGVDNRTEAQKASILKCINEALQYSPTAKILGHRDFKGVAKNCPSFDAIDEYKWIMV